MENIADAVIV